MFVFLNKGINCYKITIEIIIKIIPHLPDQQYFYHCLKTYNYILELQIGLQSVSNTFT